MINRVKKYAFIYTLLVILLVIWTKLLVIQFHSVFAYKMFIDIITDLFIKFISILFFYHLSHFLNESLNTISGTSFYFDEKDGVFGFNTDSQRGADTFHPFKSGGETKLIYKDKITISATGEYLIQTINENGKYIILANTPASVYKYGTSYVGDTVTIRINGVTPSDIDTTMAASFIIMDLYAGDKVGVWTQRIANAGGDRTLSLEIYKI